MASNTNSYESKFTPKFGFCNDVKVGDDYAKRIVWLVPHVINYKKDTEIITWRCNWGNVCESRCVYAMSRKQVKDTRITQEYLSKTSLNSLFDQT